MQIHHNLMSLFIYTMLVFFFWECRIRYNIIMIMIYPIGGKDIVYRKVIWKQIYKWQHSIFQPELWNSSENIVKKQGFFHGSTLGKPPIPDFYSSQLHEKNPIKTYCFPMNFIIPNLFPNMLQIWNISFLFFQISVYSLHLLFTMNSVINPFIYAWMSRDFKTAFKRILGIREKSQGAFGATDVGSTSQGAGTSKVVTATGRISTITGNARK